VPTLLEATSISKAFAGVQALRGVSFDLIAGEVHALVGENGAGKSTLIRIVGGAEVADSGSLTIGGRTVDRLDPAAARALGIAVIYQHPVLFPALSVAENIALPLESGRRLRRVDWPARRRQASRLLDEIGAAIDPDRAVDTLSMPDRQLVEIAKAIGAESRILIMDEPTAALTEREVASLLDTVRRLRARGAGVIYITHKLEEVFAIADRITVLRDGESVATRRADAIASGELVRLMIGREPAPARPRRSARSAEVALELRAVSNRSRGVHDVSCAVHRGEIFGVSGLVGSGRTELAETIFGLTPLDGGEILVDGKVADIASPEAAIRLRIGYVPEDRQRHGVIGPMSVAVNATLSRLDSTSSRGLVDRTAERRIAETYVERLQIKTPSVDAAVEALSGGNQQKVAVARWLSTEPRVLILDEPTQGVDVGAKAEIHNIIVGLAEQGLAIIMISSEQQELLAISDRIAVMRAGTIAGIVSREEATPEILMTLALGHAA
jgi:rhamnose transport system ATP-binding protein